MDGGGNRQAGRQRANGGTSQFDSTNRAKESETHRQTGGNLRAKIHDRKKTHANAPKNSCSALKSKRNRG